MFAPDGYTPLADIKRLATIDAEDLRSWSSNLLIESMSYDKEFTTDFFNYRASRARAFSFEDIFETAFNNVVRNYKLCVCHPEKGIWRFGFSVLESLMSYRHLLANNEWFDPDYFDDYLDWPFYENEILRRVAAKEDPWCATFLEFPQTSISLFYNRSTYAIDLREYDEVSKYVRGVPPTFFFDECGFNADDVRPFQGWALCVEESISHDKFRDDFRDTFARFFCKTVFGEWFIEDYADGQPDVWRRIVGLEDVDTPMQAKGTISIETAAFKEIDAYISKNDELETKAEIKIKFGKNLGERAFDRVWDRLRVEHPRISIPGRRKKP